LPPVASNKPSFSVTHEDEHDKEDPPMVSTLFQTSVSRSRIVGSTTNEYSIQNLQGKRYGCIQLPNISMIAILLFNGLQLVNISSH
jgi:hypothetical protein